MADDPVLRRRGRRRACAPAPTPPHAIDARARARTGRRSRRPAATWPSGSPTSTTCATGRSPSASGLPMPGVPDPGHPFVLVARDLAPADTAGLDPARVLALVTEDGGPTSHTAIVARALGLPAVVRCAGVLACPTARWSRSTARPGWSSVDAGRRDGRPSWPRAERTARQRLAAVERARGGRPTGTRWRCWPTSARRGDLAGDAGDGRRGRRPVPHRAAVPRPRPTPPTLDEQVAAYAEVFAAAAGRRRSWCARSTPGADKPLPFLQPGRRAQPGAGRPRAAAGPAPPGACCDSQLARHRRGGPGDRRRRLGDGADGGHAGRGGRVRRPVPRGRAAHGRRHGRDAGRRAAGRGATVRAVDFLSIGTNDLSQYTFAADRHVRRAGRAARPVAARAARAHADVRRRRPGRRQARRRLRRGGRRPGLAPVLAGLGITSLSMSPRSIPAVREALASHTLAECRALAAAALASDDARSARAAAAGVGGQGWACPCR